MQIKPLFSQFVFLLILSLGLIFLDYYFKGKSTVRQYLISFAKPVYQVVDIPYQTTDWLSSWFSDRQQQNVRMDQLELENSLLKVKLQQAQSHLASEKKRESQINAAENFSSKLLSANILNVNLERNLQRIVIDKGQNDSIYLGQPVIDQFGIMGQITELSVSHSIVTLITDASQSTPVLVKRNDLRTLVYGKGRVDNLAIKFMSAESDIKVGDMLVSSGIGNRYPSGYPVAKVIEINRDENESFLDISAKPLAHLTHGEQVLLIWPEGQQSDQLRNNPHSDLHEQALSLNILKPLK